MISNVYVIKEKKCFKQLPPYTVRNTEGEILITLVPSLSNSLNVFWRPEHSLKLSLILGPDTGDKVSRRGNRAERRMGSNYGRKEVSDGSPTL